MGSTTATAVTTALNRQCWQVTQKQPKATTVSGGMLWGDLCKLDGEWDHVSTLETRGMLYTSTRSSCSSTSVNHANQMLLTKTLML